MSTTSALLLAWLLTYAVHSTILLGTTGLATRRIRSPGVRDILWKTALVGGIATATVQVSLGIKPTGSFSLAASAAGAIAAPHGPAAAAPAPREATGPGAVEASPINAVVPAAPSSGAVSAGPKLPSVGTTVVLAWLIVGLTLAAVYGARRLILVGRLGDRRPIRTGPLPQMLAALRQQVEPDDDLPATIHLTCSHSISSPVALGGGEICVPEAVLSDLDEAQQRGLLAHELAHLVRRDPFWLDAASVIERVFFFQPLNRLARREMQAAAEYLCDDWAAARLGTGVPLASCLARVAEWIQASPLGVPVAGMAEQRSHLMERITRLVEDAAPRPAAPRLALLAGGAALLATMTVVVPGVSAAVDQPQMGASTPTAAEPDTEESAAVEPAPASAARQPDGASKPRGQDVAEAQGRERDSSVVTALIDRLKDSDASVRRAAASSLGNLKAVRAAPALIALLDDADREVRTAAIYALGNIEDPRAVNPILAKLRDQSPDVREAALDALGNFEKQVPAAAILPLLKDERPAVRERTASILSEIEDRSTASALRQAANDPVASVRQAVIHALSHVGDAEAGPTLVAALRDENAEVRHAALEALRELRVPVAERTLLGILEDPSEEVRYAAIEFVKERPFPGVIPVLTRLLEDPSSEVRLQAVYGLGEIADPTARRALRMALTSADANVRAAAAEKLGERP